MEPLANCVDLPSVLIGLVTLVPTTSWLLLRLLITSLMLMSSVDPMSLRGKTARFLVSNVCYGFTPTLSCSEIMS